MNLSNNETLTVCLWILIFCLFSQHSVGAQKLDKEACLDRWPGINLNAEEAASLTEKGLQISQSAGEHPSYESIEQIVAHLSRAAAANSTEAQKGLGFYVVGFWMTDFMFWPKQKQVAVDALAFLRISMIKELTKGPPHIQWMQGLGVSPPYFDEDSNRLPTTWLNLAIKAASHWQRCFVLIKGYSAVE